MTATTARMPTERLPPQKLKHQPGVGLSMFFSGVARKDYAELLLNLQTTASGLSDAEAEKRLHTLGRNELVLKRSNGWPLRLLRTAANPLVILLAILAAISFLAGDPRAGVVMVTMVIIGVGTRFWQEARADTAVAKLQTLIIHIIRTKRFPFLQSRASWPLVVATGLILAFAVGLPSSFMAPASGLVRLPGLYWLFMSGILLCYLATAQSVKTWLSGRGWI